MDGEYAGLIIMGSIVGVIVLILLIALFANIATVIKYKRKPQQQGQFDGYSWQPENSSLDIAQAQAVQGFEQAANGSFSQQQAGDDLKQAADLSGFDDSPL